MLLDQLRRLRRDVIRKGRARRNSNRSIQEIFTDAYQEGHWGTGDDFDSGSGTRSDEAVDPYVAAIAEIGRREGFSERTFVDLGCGDFRVGRRLAPLCHTYIGVDVVPDLIDRNRQKFGSDRIRFDHLDVVADALPAGDVCFIRQVLQHLSNAQIAQVLPKLRQFRWVFITEHQPSPGRLRTPNLDKVAGSDIRLYEGSGVYLEESPFGIPRGALSDIVSAPSRPMGSGIDAGVIRTILFEPGKIGDRAA